MGGCADENAVSLKDAGSEKNENFSNLDLTNIKTMLN
jgi:hypothetical protein